MQENGKILRAGQIEVFNLEVGNCAKPPIAKDHVGKDLTMIDVMPCTDPHTMEVYFIVDINKYIDAKTTDYPGDKKMKELADARCANEFEGFVGIPYTKSTLFFTYLTPSARSWTEKSDRKLTCFVTSAGAELPKPTAKGANL